MWTNARQRRASCGRQQWLFLTGKKPICQQTLSANPPADLEHPLERDQDSGAQIHRGTWRAKMPSYHVDVRAPLLSSGEADDLFRFSLPSCFHGLWDRKEKHGGQDVHWKKSVLYLFHSSRKGLPWLEIRK